MNCGHNRAVKYGRIYYINGSVQKYKCRDCGASWSDRLPVNKIHKMKLDLAVAVLKGGGSCQAAANASGLCKRTTMRIRRENLPECNHRMIKSGFFRHNNGTTQRFRCLDCGKTWSEKQVNRIKKEKRIFIESMLRRGASIRSVGAQVGVHTNTVKRIRARIGIIGRGPSNNKDYRYRPDYIRKWASVQPLSQYERTNRNHLVRAFIGEVLAVADRPLTAREIFLCCTIPFPHLKQFSVTNMLKRNMEMTFKEVEGGWTYVPSFHYPNKPKPNDPLDGTWRARVVYFQKHGLRDEVVDEKIEELIGQNKEHIEDIHASAAVSSAGFLSLTHAAQQVTKHLNETKNHPQE